MKHALFAMIPQALMVILLIYIGGMVNPLPIDSDSSANSTIGLKVCCDSLCSGELQELHVRAPPLLIIAIARAYAVFTRSFFPLQSLSPLAALNSGTSREIWVFSRTPHLLM